MIFLIQQSSQNNNKDNKSWNKVKFIHYNCNYSNNNNKYNNINKKINILNMIA